MTLKTLVTSIVASLAVSSAASAQWSSGGFGIGVGGSYNKTTLPNGQSITNNNLNWGVGLGGSSFNGPMYGMGYGMGGYGMGYGGWGYGGYGMGYGGYGCYPPVVMPYYGGGCAPVVVPYSPFTGTYANPCYSPQVIAPAAFCPQAPVVW